jgi:hypothetical protein
MIAIRNFATGGSVSSASSFSSGAWSSALGSLIVAGIRYAPAQSISSVKNAAGQSLSLISGTVFTPNSAQTVALYYLGVNSPSGSDAITVILSGSLADTGLAVWEITGCLPSPVDVATGFQTNSTVSSLTSAAFTTTWANEIVLVFGGVAHLTNTHTISGTAGTYTTDSSGLPSGGLYSGAGHIIVNSILTGSTAKISVSPNSASGSMSVATFKGIPSLLGTLGVG